MEPRIKSMLEEYYKPEQENLKKGWNQQSSGADSSELREVYPLLGQWEREEPFPSQRLPNSNPASTYSTCHSSEIADAFSDNIIFSGFISDMPPSPAEECTTHISATTKASKPKSRAPVPTSTLRTESVPKESAQQTPTMTNEPNNRKKWKKADTKNVLANTSGVVIEKMISNCGNQLKKYLREKEILRFKAFCRRAKKRPSQQGFKKLLYSCTSEQDRKFMTLFIHLFERLLRKQWLVQMIMNNKTLDPLTYIAIKNEKILYFWHHLRTQMSR